MRTGTFKESLHWGRAHENSLLPQLLSAAGGEDRVFFDECSMLEEHGHQVKQWSCHNDDLHQLGQIGRDAEDLLEQGVLSDRFRDGA